MDHKEYIKEIKHKFPLAEIEKYLQLFENKKVLVIGDTIIDEYCFVNIKGRAMKDPILSVDYVNEEVYAGGILAIANHISSFVKEVKVVTLLGEGLDRKDFVLGKLNHNISAQLFEKKNAPTTRKKRYVNQPRNEKLFKIEYMDDSPISLELENQLVHFLEQEIPKHDLVIVGDFGHGFINETIVKLLETKAPHLAVNSQTNSANLGFNYVTKYNAPSFMTMDGTELKFAVGDRFSDYNVMIEKLYQKKKFKSFLVTLGKNGAAYYHGGTITHAPSLVSKVTDVVGAGDAVFSVASLLAYSQVPAELLAFLANCVGGIKVSIMGNKESITKEGLLQFIGEKYKEIEEMEIHNYLSTVNNALGSLDRGIISKFVDVLLEAYGREKTIYIFGNGGSAATASHFCGDLVKGVSYGLEKRFKAVCLNDNTPAIMAIANDISYDDIFVEQLKNFLNKDDVVIGISGSGNSKNIVKALEYAQSAGAKTIAICGYKGGKIKEIADLSIHAEINDMEISEDVHNLVITHCVKRLLTTELKNNNLGEKYVQRTA